MKGDIPGEEPGTSGMMVTFTPDDTPEALDYKYGIFSRLVENWTGGVNLENLAQLLIATKTVYESISKEE